MKHRPLNIAHRGASGHAPENTMAAFRLAIEQGADRIEFDIHQTSDGRLVVLHDFSLKRTGGDPRRAVNMTLEEIKKLDVGAWAGPGFRGQRVPTLEEVLDFAAGRTSVQIEIKRGSPFYSGIEPRLLSILGPYREKVEISVSSFDHQALAELRRLDSGITIGLLTDKTLPRQILKDAAAVRARSIHIAARRLSRALIRQAHAAGLSVCVYTVNRPWRMRRFLDLGADGLFTNHPDRLTAVLAEREFPSKP
ncbi:MAG TPA: glycerophosphodiester phosphodiesterase family protein [Nitrospiria bacterium]